MATYAKAAQYYDQLYSFKNYTEETAKIKELIRSEHPTAQTVLDVACGTAEHARLLANDFQIDGIDLEPAFIEIASKKVPSGQFQLADMRNFELDRRYDVIQCLFSSIGYLTHGKDVIAALKCFRQHLNPGGVIIVEPWFTPDTYHAGHCHMTTYDGEETKICRMNVSERTGNLSRLKFHYLVAKKEGIESFEDDHHLMLYTVEEMLSFFKAAGLAVKHDPVGLTGRGLYVAR